jgi:hypothetical protein
MNKFGFDLTTKEGKSAYAKAYHKENYVPKKKSNQFGVDLSTKEGKAAYAKAWRKKNYVPSSRINQFGFDVSTREGRIAYAKSYRDKYRDPAKEAERMRKWRFGKGREAYLKNKKNWVKNNPEASKESQRKAYTRRWFKGLNAPPELIEAKHLQLMIERVSKNEKRI